MLHGKKWNPASLSCLRFYQVTLYLRTLTSQMDVMPVFCIICSPIRVMLCKSELMVDGCNLRGCSAYVYLRSSIVQKTKRRAQVRGLLVLALAPTPTGVFSKWLHLLAWDHPAREGNETWSSAFWQPWDGSPRGLSPQPTTEYWRNRSPWFQSFCAMFLRWRRIAMCALGLDRRC